MGVISVLRNFFVALFSGFSEFFYVPSFAHRKLFEILSGTDQSQPWLLFSIHLGALIGVILACKKRIVYLMRADRQERNTRRRKNRHLDMNAVLEIRMLKTAAIPMLLVLFFYNRFGKNVSSTLMLSIMLLFNGLILFLPRILPKGNKDCRMMSPLDSLILGLGGALALIPGVSRLTAVVTAGALRGTDTSQTLEYGLILSVPVLIVLLGFDLYALILAKTALSAWMLLKIVIASALAAAGGYAGILFMRFMSEKAGFYSFCYYSWGVALFSFVLYLLI